MIIAKFGLGAREKYIGIKDNAETQSALSFAEKSELGYALAPEKRRQDRRTPQNAYSKKWLCHFASLYEGRTAAQARVPVLPSRL